MSQEKELGTLVIVVLKARNLLDPHSFYKSDVYAQISLNGEVKRTPVEVKGGQHPVWDAELRFNVMKNSAEKYRELKVSCWSKESRNDQNLGEGKVNINETLKTGEFDDWVGLSTEAGGARGDLYLEMTYYSAAPVPAASRLSVSPGADLVRRPSKLSPADRLSRPTQPSPLSTSGAHLSHHDNRRRDPSPHNRPPPSQLVPGRVSPQRPTSVSPKRANDPLPPLPNDRVQSPTIPAFLQPGAGRGKPSASSFQPSQPAQPPQPTLPDILKPGIPNGSSFHNPTPQPTLPLQQPVQPSHNPGSPPRHYTSYPTTHSPPPPSTYVSATGPPYAEPQIRPHPHINPYVSPPVQHPPVSPAPPAGPEPWVTQGPPHSQTMVRRHDKV
ncbi:hypothetical protein ONZ45_g14192 [Pleurotus djamor]|nr:hypothetical protein ONZ45_g14192 [Pleurotus djamor]